MLKEEMEKDKYDYSFIEKCYSTIEKHKWNMLPKTNEGLVVKDKE